MKKILLILLAVSPLLAGWNIGIWQNDGADIGIDQDAGGSVSCDSNLTDIDTTKTFGNAVAASCSLYCDSGTIYLQWTSDTSGSITQDSATNKKEYLYTDTIPGLSPSDSIYWRFVFASLSGGTDDTTAWEMTYTQDSTDTTDWAPGGGSAAEITAEPSNVTCYIGEQRAFTVDTLRTDSLRWQLLTGETWGGITGATGLTYTTPATVYADNGSQYRVIAYGAGGDDTSAVCTLTVQYRVATITANPTAQSKTAGQPLAASVTATGDSLAYQWQRVACGGWADISGATTATLTDTVWLFWNGDSIRAIVSNAESADTSTPALVTVTATFSRDAYTARGTTWQDKHGRVCGLGTWDAIEYCGDSTWILGGVLGLIRSTDNGLTWTYSSRADSIQEIYHVNGDTVLMTSRRAPKIWRSLDLGATWTDLEVSTIDTSTRVYKIIRMDNDTLMAAGTDSASIHTSADGITWSAGYYPGTVSIFSLVENGGGKVTAFSGGAQAHIYHTDDYGATWTDSGQLGSQTHIYAADKFPGADSILLCVTNGAYAYRSTDSGMTWDSVYAFAGSTSALAVTCLAGGAAVVGTNTDIWTTWDYGVSWTKTSTVPTASYAREFAVDNSYGRIIAAATGTTNGARLLVSDYTLGLTINSFTPAKGKRSSTISFVSSDLIDSSASVRARINAVDLTITRWSDGQVDGTIPAWAPRGFYWPILAHIAAGDTTILDTASTRFRVMVPEILTGGP
jgi:photosystem II stability/assembly factor-like uncharacterized protein